ncbi:MAG: type 2 isopentenyl-diphosphate Delta-isomerase [Candidatus Lokiarchaeota archaeon]|nr:type 2 isopentenyl-diphosphate Delta-isomerase [Candidatus Lokiarchaeota archaeon]
MAKDQSIDVTDIDDGSSEASLTKRRKIEHIEICLDEDVQCRRSTMFEDIELLHNALPEINKDDIDLTTNFLGLRANYPLVIAAMTGGHPETYEINRRLAEAAEELKIPIGVGSQRSGLENPELADTFKIVRECAPTVPVIANIGATHVNLAADAVSMIEADILAIHLNPLQEAIQPEGDCNSIGVIDNIAQIVESVDVPVICKETGAGISGEVAKALESVGVDGIDVGGVGGTSWAAVEYYRALREDDAVKAQMGLEFWDFGIPTALSVIMVSTHTDLEIIATGGIRTGLDIAKSLSLGAIAAGVAHPFLYPATRGTTEDVIDEITKFIEGLRTAMYLTGCDSTEKLQIRPLIIRGDLLESLKSLGIDYENLVSGNQMDFEIN